MGHLWILGDFGFSRELLNYFLSIFPSWWTASLNLWAITGFFFVLPQNLNIGWVLLGKASFTHPSSSSGMHIHILLGFVGWILGIFPEDIKPGCWDTPVWHNWFSWELKESVEWVRVVGWGKERWWEGFQEHQPTLPKVGRKLLPQLGIN